MAEALGKISAQRAVVANLEEEMENRQQDIDGIVKDQGRLRENRKALRGSAEERVLVQDRKSTRLNSSHGYISYAVFCLKKKNQPLHACGEVTVGRTHVPPRARGVGGVARRAVLLALALLLPIHGFPHFSRPQPTLRVSL